MTLNVSERNDFDKGEKKKTTTTTTTTHTNNAHYRMMNVHSKDKSDMKRIINKNQRMPKNDIHSTAA